MLTIVSHTSEAAVADYRLDQLDTGVVRAGENDWRFFVVRVMSLPEDVCEAQYLIFGNMNRRGDVMRKRIPADLTRIDDAALVQFARQADERELLTEHGRVEIRRAGELHVERKWIVRPEKGMTMRRDLMVERSICDLTAADLEILTSG